jgi:hypothetical protein
VARRKDNADRHRGSVPARARSPWRRYLVINGIGAVATFVVLMIFIVTKFIHGAWIVVLLIPLLVQMFLRIHRHYVDVAEQLSTEALPDCARFITR